jgi:hypothetical protein
MTRYQNTTPLLTRKYKAVLKRRSGNIYIVNVDDTNDFFAFNGDPKDISYGRVYSFIELEIKGSYAKIKSDSFARRKSSMHKSGFEI